MTFLASWTDAVKVVVYTSVLVILWFVFKIWITAFDRDLRQLPGPWLSRLSNLPLKLAVMGGRRSHYIHDLHLKYGSFVRIGPNEVAVADIEAYRRIHRVGSNFGKGPWYQGQSPLQYNDETCGIFGIRNNKTASQRRRLFQSAGTKKSVAEWEPEVADLANLTVENIKRELKTNQKADIMKWWTFMTSDVLGSLAFGESYNNVANDQKSQLVLDVEGVMPFIGIRMTLPWLGELLEIIPNSWLGKFAPPWDRFTKYGKTAVQNTRAALKGGQQTLFSKMVHESEGDQTVPDRIIEQEAANVIVAGTDTTAMCLTYLVYEVLKNPEIKTKLIDAIKDCSTRPQWVELEGIEYLNNVIQETLRLHPPVPGSLMRVVPSGEEDLGLYRIPAGTIISTQALTFHRDLNVFPDPLRFNPDRWTNQLLTPEMKEHFMAFGGPVRNCLGQNIARLEMLHAVFALFRGCPDIRLGGGGGGGGGKDKMEDEGMETEMEMVDYFTIKPKGGVCFVVPA